MLNSKQKLLRSIKNLYKRITGKDSKKKEIYQVIDEISENFNTVYLDLSASNVYAQALNAYNSKAVVSFKNNGERYFADTITKDGTNIIITKGGKTITINDVNAVSSEGDIQSLNKYLVLIHTSDDISLNLYTTFTNLPFKHSGEVLDINIDIFDYLDNAHCFTYRIVSDNNGKIFSLADIGENMFEIIIKDVEGTSLTKTIRSVEFITI